MENTKTLRTVIKFRDHREPMEVMETYEDVLAKCKAISFPNLLVEFRAYNPGTGEIQRAVVLGDIREVIKY